MSSAERRIAGLIVRLRLANRPPFSRWLAVHLFARNKPLCNELLRTRDLDQRTIMRGITNRQKQLRILQTHTERMKVLIAQYGWLGYSLVGPMGADAAWLLVQHSDQDVPFQKYCLGLLEQSVAAGDADPRHLAYLTDRVLVAEGKRQRYGTQFHGQHESLPIEDEAHVDERRAQMGLEPLDDYIRTAQQAFGKLRDAGTRRRLSIS
jgi:hypothetical protein